MNSGFSSTRNKKRVTEISKEGNSSRKCFLPSSRVPLGTRHRWTESAVYQMSCCLTFSLSSQPNSLSLQPFFPNGGSRYAIHSLFSPLTMKSTKNMKSRTAMKSLIAFVVLLTLSCSLLHQPTNP